MPRFAAGPDVQPVGAVVVNDGSIDATASNASRYAATDVRIRRITQGRCGVSEARNTGIAATSFEWLLFVDPQGFDPSLQTCEDWDLWQRVARTAARFGAITDVVAR